MFVKLSDFLTDLSLRLHVTSKVGDEAAVHLNRAVDVIVSGNDRIWIDVGDSVVDPGLAIALEYRDSEHDA